MDYLRYSAFTTPSGGGNPAGVVLDAAGAEEIHMLALAAELGYSETAFLSRIGEREYAIRYFSPQAEVDFCGHATVAASVALAEDRYGAGSLLLHSNVGEIPVEIVTGERGLQATLTAVVPDTGSLDARSELLSLLRWDESDLDHALPSGLAYGGLWHPVLWAASRERLSVLDYDFDGLKELMLRKGWGTVSLLFRESPALVHSRNAFPIGGVVEDPATGAAAAALGGFLRAHALLPADGRFTVLQGEDMEQPCLLEVDASGEGGVRVSGTTQPISV
ncbi:PhzF family phenazine biosynthesis protein [Leucobacter sp. GX24907]